tara:strand:- start:516 stop:704 length:189 start_codon:yes stop_codon:yes gene_type:complete
MKKRATKEPYEGYTLPPSAEKGGQFVDFNKVLKRIINPKKVKVIKKKRVTILEKIDDKTENK